MNVLVLGAEGQIGSALANRLQPEHVVLRWDVEIDERMDLRDSSCIESLTGAMEWADFVYFLAFDVGGSAYLAKHQHTTAYLSNNVRIMENFCAAHEACVEAPDFVFASTQMSNMLYSSYGVLKRLGEFYTTALGGINVRFWNVYGNEFDPEKFHVVTDFVNAARSGQAIRMRTDGREQRQMLHSEDSADALVALMENRDRLDRSKYFDITSFEWVTIREIGEFIAAVFEVECIPGESTDDVQRDARNEPTDEIAKYWSPRLTLEEGIMKVIDAMGDT